MTALPLEKTQEKIKKKLLTTLEKINICTTSNVRLG